MTDPSRPAFQTIMLSSHQTLVVERSTTLAWGSDSVLSIHIPKPEDNEIVEVAAILPKVSSSTSDETSTCPATVTATVTQCTAPKSSTPCEFEEEEDPDAPPFDYISGADEDDDARAVLVYFRSGTKWRREPV